MSERKLMDDRQMLLFAYGALKAISTRDHTLSKVIDIVEEHLYPPKVEIKQDASRPMPITLSAAELQDL